MAPLAPAPSARPGTGPPTSPTDGAVGSRHQLPLPVLLATSAALVSCMYAYSCMHVHDEQVARHARHAHFPSLYPPSPPVCFLALRGPSLAPSLLWPSLPFSPCSLSPVYLFFLLSFFFLLRPAPSLARCTTLYQALPLSAGW